MKEDRLRIVLIALGMQSLVFYMAMIVIYGLCSPITVILATLSAALWLWIFISHMKKRIAMGSIPLLSDLNIVIATAAVISLSTLIVDVVAILCPISK